jgi:hypothetical protein
MAFCFRIPERSGAARLFLSKAEYGGEFKFKLTFRILKVSAKGASENKPRRGQ